MRAAASRSYAGPLAPPFELEVGRRRLWRSSGVGTAGALATLMVLSKLSLVPWDRLEDWVGRPLNQLLNPRIGPAMAQVLGAEGFGFIILALLAMILSEGGMRSAVGEGILLLFQRAVRFVAALAVVFALCLLTGLNASTLRTDLVVHGSPYFLSLPTLLATAFFGLQALTVPPKPRPRFLPKQLDILTYLLGVPALVGAALFAFQASSRVESWGKLQAWVTTPAMAGIESAFLLTVVAVVLADWPTRLTLARSGWKGRVLEWIKPGLRLTALAGPPVFGIYLASVAQLPELSRIEYRDGSLMTHYYSSGRFQIPVPPNQISFWAPLFLDSTEDHGVYMARSTYVPINPVSVSRSLFQGISSENGEVTGGSGVPAQSCKNAVGRPLVGLLSLLPDQTPGLRYLVGAATMVHKAAFEMTCGWAFARSSLLLPKDRQPAMFYLNQVYFGHGAHGIEAAAQVYFGKHASELAPHEAALLVGLVQAPGGPLDPWTKRAAALERRQQVLDAARRDRYITEDDYRRWSKSDLGVLKGGPLEYAEPSLATQRFVRYVMDRLDSMGLRDISTGGYTIRTTLDRTRQARAEKAVKSSVGSLARFGVNNGAIVQTNATTGEVLAMVGGLGSLGGDEAERDMAFEEPHSLGSLMTPLLQACFSNYSKNQATDAQRLVGTSYMVDVMGPEEFARCLTDRFHIKSALHPEQHGVDLGAGLEPLRLPEIAGAYGVLARGGQYVEPNPVLQVTDRNDWVVYRGPGPSSVAFDDQSITSAYGRMVQGPEVGLPARTLAALGKTDTSSMVAGFDPSGTVTVVWVGTSRPKVGPVKVEPLPPGRGAINVWQALESTR